MLLCFSLIRPSCHTESQHRVSSQTGSVGRAPNQCWHECTGPAQRPVYLRGFLCTVTIFNSELILMIVGAFLCVCVCVLFFSFFFCCCLFVFVFSPFFSTDDVGCEGRGIQLQCKLKGIPSRESVGQETENVCTYFQLQASWSDSISMHERDRGTFFLWLVSIWAPQGAARF